MQRLGSQCCYKMAAPAIKPREVLALYRNLLRQGSQFTSFNYRYIRALFGISSQPPPPHTHTHIHTYTECMHKEEFETALKRRRPSVIHT